MSQKNSGSLCDASSREQRVQLMEKVSSVFNGKLNILGCFVFFEAVQGTATGQLPGTTPTIPGMFQNMLPLTGGQFGALPMMPVQAMTQQVGFTVPLSSSWYYLIIK
ncbi:hypothetical protein ACS0TY_003537 [Phlomoides rotata]